MRYVSDTLKDMARSRGAIMPAIWADVYADTGPMAELSSAAQWQGAKDPSVGLDSNVDAVRQPGSMVLAAGGAVAEVAPVTPDIEAGSASYSVQRQDYWDTVGNWITGTSTRFLSVTFTIKQAIAPMRFQYQEAATKIIDTINLRASYASNHGFAMPCWVRLLTVNGDQVGKAVQFTPTAVSPAVATHTVSGLAAPVVGGRQYILDIVPVPPTNGQIPGPIAAYPGPTYTDTVTIYGYSGDGNLWPYSEDLTHRTGVQGATTPDFETMLQDTSTGPHRILLNADASSMVGGEIRGMMINAEYVDWQYMGIILYGPSGSITANVDLVNGVFDVAPTGTLSGIDGVILSDGAGGWNIAVWGTSPDASIHGRLYFGQAGGATPSFTGDGTSTIRIKRFQEYINVAWMPYYCKTTGAAVAAIDSNWRIALQGAGVVSVGGRRNYQANGSFMRTIDVGSVPTVDGLLSIADVVPVGTSMTVDLYYTDSAAIAANADLTGWTHLGLVSSGQSLPPHRYWRVLPTLNASAGGDLSPQLTKLQIRYIPDPVRLGTAGERIAYTEYGGFQLPVALPIQWSQTQRVVMQTKKALDSIGTFSAQFIPKLQKSMIGQQTIALLPEPVVHALAAKPLRGRRVDVRVGYVGVDDKIDLYSQIVVDLTYSGLKYNLKLTDDLTLADVNVPSTKAGPEWSGATDYTVGQVVISGAYSWLALTDNGPSYGGAVTPGSDAAVWQNNGTIWAAIDYTSASHGGTDWHLADILTDLLANWINIPAERVDWASITATKALYPNRTGTRVINKPTKAMDLVNELAWLLECQWIERGRMLTLVPEPDASVKPEEVIGPLDMVSNSVQWRRGWAELANTILILSGYSGDGTANGNEWFSTGESVTDAASAATYGVELHTTFEDKWSVPSTELVARATAELDRYKDGRRVIQGQVNMRLVGVEPGDVVLLRSGQLPDGEQGPVRMMVVKHDLDWARQTLAMTFVEV